MLLASNCLTSIDAIPGAGFFCRKLLPLGKRSWALITSATKDLSFLVVNTWGRSPAAVFKITLTPPAMGLSSTSVICVIFANTGWAAKSTKAAALDPKTLL